MEGGWSWCSSACGYPTSRRFKATQEKSDPSSSRSAGGTRFLAAREATSSDGYKRTILAAASQDGVKFDALNDLLPSPGTKGSGTVLRSVRTPFIDGLLSEPELARRDPQYLLGVLRAAIEAGNVYEVMPTAGQTVGGIHELLSAAEIVQGMVREAEDAGSAQPARAPDPSFGRAARPRDAGVYADVAREPVDGAT